MTRTIERILIANRGEIACRITRTCRAMGKSSVAVYSDADAHAPHVALADEAVRIGPPPSAESYLRIDRLIEAARMTGADAIHPGYGFLAENADFARACADAGLIFIGPSPDVIALLGSKRESKRVVADAGVPIIPGGAGDDQDPAALRAQAIEVGFPVLLKASAGGGGKGMRVVHHDSELDAAIDAARREAASSFGDDTLLVERYIERPRHVEIQILGDSHGNLVHLFERECSVQRRHQKIIEETPSTALDDDLRSRMGQAAIAVGRAVGYQNAGTVELILDSSGHFYFLEVNTRLQVEHPVTECVTGIDLVREQIRVAEGHSIEDLEVSLRGHALECRLYAEDPDNGFLPTSGTLLDWQVPDLPGLRVDGGVGAGQPVAIHYDPMLAKIITHAPTRAEAIQTMAYGLRHLVMPGVVTNRDYLLRVLAHPAFASGDIDTHFCADYAADLAPLPRDPERVEAAAIAITLLDHGRRAAERAVLPQLVTGYRNNRVAEQTATYLVGDQRLEIAYRDLGGGRFRVGGDREVTVAEIDGDRIAIEDSRGRRRCYRVYRDGARWFVHGAGGELALTEAPRFPDATEAAVEGGCVAPMPGKVVKVLVSAGQSVSAGEALLVLEAMKMEHTITAPGDGVVADIAVAEGDQVEADQLLIVVHAADA